MNEILKKLVNHEKLTRAESMKAMLKVGKGEIDPFQIAAFLSVYMMRSITSNELAGFRDALLKLCISVDLSDFDPIDLCGTGGDAKNTFNISTISSFVAAGAGIKVAKHGNYGVSSSCGSSNVLEFLGIRFSNKVDFLTKSIETAGICILHAPLFHPAMKHVAPIRKSLKLKTFFNILGPLVNPCFPKKQITGVFDLSLLKLYKFLLDETANSFCVIHDLNGFDEISLTGDTKIISNFGEDIISPKIFGLDRIDANKIVGGKSISESASIFLSVLKNEATIEQKEVVSVNAGLAISTSISVSLIEGYEMAKESIESKKALNSYKSLLNLSQNDNS
ncbi:MAG: anthranilate phosphoribosyltransferase [Bacteroidota bacterium]|nr:anthranilate phosphoribosyltransferase [Bacteroidota bacterium]